MCYASLSGKPRLHFTHILAQANPLVFSSYHELIHAHIRTYVHMHMDLHSLHVWSMKAPGPSSTRHADCAGAVLILLFAAEHMCPAMLPHAACTRGPFTVKGAQTVRHCPTGCNLARNGLDSISNLDHLHTLSTKFTHVPVLHVFHA